MVMYNMVWTLWPVRTPDHQPTMPPDHQPTMTHDHQPTMAPYHQPTKTLKNIKKIPLDRKYWKIIKILSNILSIGKHKSEHMFSTFSAVLNSKTLPAGIIKHHQCLLWFPTATAVEIANFSTADLRSATEEKSLPLGRKFFWVVFKFLKRVLSNWISFLKYDILYNIKTLFLSYFFSNIFENWNYVFFIFHWNMKIWNSENLKSENLQIWNLKIWKSENLKSENLKIWNLKIWKAENLKSENMKIWNLIIWKSEI